jgi:hypothetical protein
MFKTQLRLCRTDGLQGAMPNNDRHSDDVDKALEQVPVVLRRFVDAYRAAIDYDPVHEGGPDEEKAGRLADEFAKARDAVAAVSPLRHQIRLKVYRESGLSVLAAQQKDLLRVAFDRLGVGLGRGTGTIDRVQLSFLEPVLSHFGTVDDGDLAALRRACDDLGVAPEPMLVWTQGVPSVEPGPPSDWPDKFRRELGRTTKVVLPPGVRPQRVLFGVLAGLHAGLAAFGVALPRAVISELRFRRKKSKGLVDRYTAWPNWRARSRPKRRRR